MRLIVCVGLLYF